MLNSLDVEFNFYLHTLTRQKSQKRLNDFSGNLLPFGKHIDLPHRTVILLKPKSVKNMGQSVEKSKEITRMLQEWSGGKPEALNALLPLVYAELRRQVAHYLRRERARHTLQTTDLIHEAI